MIAISEIHDQSDTATISQLAVTEYSDTQICAITV